MSKLTATWTISLDTECPKCGKNIDLTLTDDFWHGMQAGEHNTPLTIDYEVTCADCEHEFKVDFTY